jgi:hypothetical protein
MKIFLCLEIYFIFYCLFSDHFHSSSNTVVKFFIGFNLGQTKQSKLPNTVVYLLQTARIVTFKDAKEWVLCIQGNKAMFSKDEAGSYTVT